MVTIRIDGLAVFARHGVFDWEKANGQEFVVDAELACEEPTADAIERTADYGAVAAFLKRSVSARARDLIESVASAAAEGILDEFASVRAARVTVHKPHAPVPAVFRDVSVAVERRWTPCCLGLGSNLGDKRAYLDAACANLSRRGIRVLARSRYYVTPPYGVLDQDDFVNACVKTETYLSPRQILAVCREEEEKARRVRTRRWGERTLDVDLLLYGDRVVDEPELTVPHVEMHKRAFVLQPLAEIAPNTVHPLLGKTIRTLWEELHAKPAPCL